MEIATNTHVFIYVNFMLEMNWCCTREKYVF